MPPARLVPTSTAQLVGDVGRALRQVKGQAVSVSVG